MNGKITKVCAVAVVMAFAFTAFAFIPADDSYASNSGKEYCIHFEEIDSNYLMTKEVSIDFKAADSTFEQFVAAANRAFSAYGIDAAFNASGWLSSTTYGSNFTTYVANGDAWAAVSDPAADYCNASTIAIEAGAGSYSATAPPAAQASSYNGPDEWGYYYRNPSVSVADCGKEGIVYHLHFEAISADYVLSDSTWITFSAQDRTLASFIAAANAAFAANGIDAAFSASGWLSSTTYGGSFSTYVAAGDVWTAVSDPAAEYCNASAIAIEAGAGSYSATAPPAAQAGNYNGPDEWGYYYRNPSVTANSFADAVSGYRVVFEIIKDDCTVASTAKISFEVPDNNMKAFILGANIAFAENGIDAAFNASGWLSSTTFGSNFATWVSDAKEWSMVQSPATDYLSSKAIAIEAGEKSYFYGSEPPADFKDKYFGPDAYGMYYRMPSVGADYFDDGKDINNLRNGLIIGGVVAAIIVAGLAYFFIGKKN